MRCLRCGKNAVIFQPYSGIALCAVHAERDLEIKAKRRIRKCGGISSGERLYVQESYGPESFALFILLHKIISGRRDVLFTSSPADATAIVLSETLTSTAYKFLRLIISGRVTDVFVSPEVKVFDPLVVIPRNEVVLYARYHGWEGADIDPFISDPFAADVCAFFNHFLMYHPSAAYALVNIRDALLQLYTERINHAL